VLQRTYENQNCSIARTLELVGERWSLLIIRDAFLGRRRFDEFRDSLGIASNVLTDRLNRLVEQGIFERVLYSERPERFEYRLTEKGAELRIALQTLLARTSSITLSDRDDPVVAVGNLPTATLGELYIDVHA